MYHISLGINPLHTLNIYNMILCNGYSYNHQKSNHSSPIICLQCTIMEIPNYKLEIGDFPLDHHYIYHFLFRPFSIHPNKQHQVSNIKSNQRDSSVIQKKNTSSINSTNIKYQTKDSLKSASCDLQQYRGVKHYV